MRSSSERIRLAGRSVRRLEVGPVRAGCAIRLYSEHTGDGISPGQGPAREAAGGIIGGYSLSASTLQALGGWGASRATPVQPLGAHERAQAGSLYSLWVQGRPYATVGIADDSALVIL